MSIPKTDRFIDILLSELTIGDIIAPDKLPELIEKFRQISGSIYMVGYDDGQVELTKRAYSGRSKAVYSIHILTKEQRFYPSITDAAKAIDIGEKRIRKALKSGEVIGDLIWKRSIV